MDSHYPPPELEGFHRRNMVHAALVFAIPMGAGVWASFREQASGANDPLQRVLEWTFIGGAVLFVATILYKALASLPKCPDCSRKMEQLRTIRIPDRPDLDCKTESRWRVVACPVCRREFRVPGLSRG